MSHTSPIIAGGKRRTLIKMAPSVYQTDLDGSKPAGSLVLEPLLKKKSAESPTKPRKYVSTVDKKKLELIKKKSQKYEILDDVSTSA